MLKRLEVYVDAALLSFAFALCVFLVLAIGLRSGACSESWAPESPGR